MLCESLQVLSIKKLKGFLVIYDACSLMSNISLMVSLSEFRFTIPGTSSKQQVAVCLRYHENNLHVD